MNLNAETKFKDLETQWSRYIQVMANRHSMESNDEGELYNDGLLILFEVSLEYPIESVSFRKMFKTKLAHMYVDYVRFNKAQCRDVKVTVPLITTHVGHDRPAENQVVLRRWVEEYFDEFESEDQVVNFFTSLNDEETNLLGELVEPSDTSQDRFDSIEYARKPSSIPLYVTAETLGWSVKKAKYCLNKIQRKYVDFTGNEKLRMLIPHI